MTNADTRLAPHRRVLAARTELLTDGGNLLDHLGPDGTAWLDGPRGFATAGIAAIVEPSHAVAALRAISRDDVATNQTTHAAIGPRAVGALPFAGGGRMIVPARIVERDRDGLMWRTVIGPAMPDTLRAAARSTTPTSYTISQVTDADAWDTNVSAVLALVDAGAVEKVVLAREVVIDASEPFDIGTIARTLHATQPDCIVYVDHGFVGASPELLVRRADHAVTARPMAGTGPRADELVHSTKDAREHHFVVEAVVGVLSTVCDDVHALAVRPVALTDLTHLATTITARVRDLDTSALDLALALHPTPAVGGTPRSMALATISRLERSPRGLYGGPCGWVDARGDGEFVVALRGAQIHGTRARLHAGAGIVAGSRSDTEWAETRAKLEPMLRALVRI
ncbi:MAG: isochorismate synthase MenF [Acidimicrobiia bacterium]